MDHYHLRKFCLGHWVLYSLCQSPLGNLLPFGNPSLVAGRRYNPLPYSPLLTRFDQDGDGDFDLQDIKKIVSRKTCGAITASGKPCKHRAKSEYNNRCPQHKSYDNSN